MKARSKAKKSGIGVSENAGSSCTRVKTTAGEEVEITEAKEEAKGKGYLMDDQIMEVNEVREPKSPSRLTYASDSGLRHRLGFRGKNRAAIKSLQNREAINLATAGMKVRTKAMKRGIGVSDKSPLEVIGDGVDVVHLTASLRKNAKLISVGPVLEQIKEAIQDEPLLFKEVEDEPKLQPPASSSVLHYNYPINETKVVIKVPVDNMKARREAMKIASMESGVLSVGLTDDKGQLVVTGYGIDVSHLVRSLRKRVGHAYLISVDAMTEQIKDAIEDEEVLLKEEEDEPKLQPTASSSVPHHIYPIDESLVDSVETEKLNGAMNMEMKTKASINSNLGSENAGSSCTSKTTEWTLLITSLLLEGISASFDQLGYAFTGMVMAFVALLLSIVDLIHKARKEGVTGDGKSLLPCFYRHSSHNSLNWKPFGSLVEYFGLAGAVWQCSYSTIEYYYTRQNKDNPIKMCLLPFIFELCVVISKLVKSHPHEPLVKLEPT